MHFSYKISCIVPQAKPGQISKKCRKYTFPNSTLNLGMDFSLTAKNAEYKCKERTICNETNHSLGIMIPNQTKLCQDPRYVGDSKRKQKSNSQNKKHPHIFSLRGKVQVIASK